MKVDRRGRLMDGGRAAGWRGLADSAVPVDDPVCPPLRGRLVVWEPREEEADEGGRRHEISTGIAEQVEPKKVAATDSVFGSHSSATRARSLAAASPRPALAGARLAPAPARSRVARCGQSKDRCPAVATVDAQAGLPCVGVADEAGTCWAQAIPIRYLSGQAEGREGPVSRSTARAWAVRAWRSRKSEEAAARRVSSRLEKVQPPSPPIPARPCHCTRARPAFGRPNRRLLKRNKEEAYSCLRPSRESDKTKTLLVRRPSAPAASLSPELPSDINKA
ncbi:hypothetical protein CDD83_11211 [Cordyceps sp. RAO-2017]|nr:hypothetical protein CDD83_11211 [Cordyceps sp. RAO-2017]